MKSYFILFIAFLLIQLTTLAQEPFLIDTISTVTCEQFNPAITAGGSKYMVFWEDDRIIPINLHGAVINSEGIVQTKTEIWNSYHRFAPSIAFDGNKFFLAYKRYSIVATLTYNSTGVVVYPFEIPHYGGDVYYDPEIVFGDSSYLVIWPCDGDGRVFGLEGRMLSPNGMMGDLFNIIREPPDHISLAFSGENYLVALEEFDNVYGERIDASGVPIPSANIKISVKPTIEQKPEITFGGSNYLIVWQDDRNGTDFDIYGARVTPSGEVLDTLGLPISLADSNQVNPEITFDGENYIVVWEDYRSGIESDIYGAKVDTDGNVIESFLISTQEGEQLQPALYKGSSNQVLVVYSGWTGEYQGKTYNSMRIWGKMLGEPNNVNEDINNFVVKNFKLEQNYPNPFNPNTKMKYSIPQSSNVIIKVFDLLGNKIETLVNEEKQVGNYEITWYAEDVPSGVYFYQLKAGSFVETKKMVLMK
jgi:hypothetical protein